MSPFQLFFFFSENGRWKCKLIPCFISSDVIEVLPLSLSLHDFHPIRHTRPSHWNHTWIRTEFRDSHHNALYWTELFKSGCCSACAMSWWASCHVGELQDGRSEGWEFISWVSEETFRTARPYRQNELQPRMLTSLYRTAEWLGLEGASGHDLAQPPCMSRVPSIAHELRALPEVRSASWCDVPSWWSWFCWERTARLKSSTAAALCHCREHCPSPLGPLLQKQLAVLLSEAPFLPLPAWSPAWPHPSHPQAGPLSMCRDMRAPCSGGWLWPFANPGACGQHSMIQLQQLLTTPITMFAQQHRSSEPFLLHTFSLSTAITES